MNTIFYSKCLLIFCFLFLRFYLTVSAVIPHPDHVVVLVLENRSYAQVFGAAAAPYINGLISDPKTALFTQSFGVSHPSQPNYLQIFSGSNQGVTNNVLPAVFPFTTPNLGAQLIAASKTFAGYSEDLPAEGSNIEISGLYARKHNGWVNWQGTGTNNIPATTNKPFSAFPTNFNLLPSVSFVVPNLDNDMHNGTIPTTLTTCDNWVQTNLNAYIQWCKTNNSLFILTFDEDDNLSAQHILTYFTGQMVQPGSYSNYIDHYSILRLLEDMFNLSALGSAATAVPIDYCWASTTCSQTPTITGNGPASFCQGGSITLTSSVGNSYLWSNGATTQSIIVTTSGNYSVGVSYTGGCLVYTSPVTVSVNSFVSQGTVMNETMGTVAVTTAIATHDANGGFDNDALVMTGTGDVRASSPSSGYTNASAAGNIFLTNTAGKNFIISGINTSGLTNLQLSFGVFKSTTASTGSDLLFQVSTDGINYTTLSYPALPSGAGTAIWRSVTVTGAIPAAPNLRIQFLQTGTTTQYRIDDIVLNYSITTPVITAGGPTTFCAGGNVVLSSTFANGYYWSTGASTQNITVSAPGNYSVMQTGSNGCTAISGVINVSNSPGPVVTGFSPVAAMSGVSVSILGSGFSGVTGVYFNGVPSANITVVNSGQINAVVPAGASSGLISVSTNCGTGNSVASFTVIPALIPLTLKLYIQGFYRGGGQMISVLGGGICDSVTVELHKNIYPFTNLHSVKGVVNTSGVGAFNFPGSLYDSTFYIVVYNRNSIQTWSSSATLIRMNASYDFSISASQTYGSNCKNLGDGNFALYSGDVTQDGTINQSDFTAIKNAIQNFQTGYKKEDLTGDNIVESADFCLIENNIIPIFSVHP